MKKRSERLELTIDGLSGFKKEIMPPLSSFSIPFLPLPHCSPIPLFSLFHLSPGTQPRVISISLFLYSHSSFYKRHTQKHSQGCILDIVAHPLLLACCFSHAGTHKFYLTRWDTPLLASLSSLSNWDLLWCHLTHSHIKSNRPVSLPCLQVNGSQWCWLISGWAWGRIHLISGV